MIQYLLYFIFLQTSSSCHYCTTYINDDLEIVSICPDTIMYRLKNGGGITTYSFGLGRFEKKANKILINSIYFPFVRYEDFKSKKSNNTDITILENDLSPIKYAPVQISINEDTFNFYTDSLGQFSISSIPLGKNKAISVKVLSIGSTFEYLGVLKKYRLNKLTLLTPRFFAINNVKDFHRKFIKIKSLDYDNFEIYDPILDKWKFFRRIKRNKSFNECVNHLLTY